MTEPLGDGELARLRELLAGASPPGWRVHEKIPGTVVDANGAALLHVFHGGTEELKAQAGRDAAFVAEARDALPGLVARLVAAEAERDRLAAAVREHHSQRADDLCWMDDDKLYEAAGLPPRDRRVGDKAAMLENCRRFIERRCEGGGWPTYREVEAQRDALRAGLRELRDAAEGLDGLPGGSGGRYARALLEAGRLLGEGDGG
jgi:hypothetical protein